MLYLPLRVTFRTTEHNICQLCVLYVHVPVPGAYILCSRYFFVWLFVFCLFFVVKKASARAGTYFTAWLSSTLLYGPETCTTEWVQHTTDILYFSNPAWFTLTNAVRLSSHTKLVINSLSQPRLSYLWSECRAMQTVCITVSTLLLRVRFVKFSNKGLSFPQMRIYNFH